VPLRQLGSLLPILLLALRAAGEERGGSAGGGWHRPRTPCLRVIRERLARSQAWLLSSGTGVPSRHSWWCDAHLSRVPCQAGAGAAGAPPDAPPQEHEAHHGGTRCDSRPSCVAPAAAQLEGRRGRADGIGVHALQVEDSWTWQSRLEV
jgi:hypothetical protein